MRHDLSAQASQNVSVRREGMAHSSLANGDVDGDDEVSLLVFGVLTRPLGMMGDDEPILQATRPRHTLLLQATRSSGLWGWGEERASHPVQLPLCTKY